MANKVGSLRIDLVANIANFERNLKRAGRKLDRFGRDMSRVGASMTAWVTAPMLAAGGAAVKFAADYETAFAGVRKTVDATEEQFAALSAGIKEMSTVVPTAVEDIAGVVEAAGQLGIANENLLDFSRTMIDLGNATNVTAQEAAVSLARIASITGMSASEYDNMGSSIVALGNNFEVFESEIIATATGMAAAAKIAKMHNSELLALAAAYASVGVQADIARSVTTKLVQTLTEATLQGGSQLERLGRIAGVTGQQFREMYERDSAGAIASFVEGLQRISEEGGNVFRALEEVGLSDKRMVTALLSIAGAGDKLRRMLRLSKDEWTENSALTNEVSERYKTFSSQLEMFKNKLKLIAIETGEKLIPKLEEMLPLLERMASVVGTILDKFASLPQEVQIALLVTGPVMQGAGAVAQIAGAFMKLPGWAKLVGAALLIGGGAWTYFANKTNDAADALDNANESMREAVVITPSLETKLSNLATKMQLFFAFLRTGPGETPSSGGGFSFKNWMQGFEDFQDTLRSWGDTVADELTSAIMKWQEWKDVFRNIVDQILADMLRLTMQRVFIMPAVEGLSGALGLPSPYGRREEQGYSGGIVVENHATGLVSVQSGTGSDGRPRAIIKSVVAEMFASGEMESTMSDYGARRRPRRR